MSIVAKLKSVNDAATAAQLSELIRGTTAELSKAEAEVARLESTHGAVLLGSDDKTLDRHEQQTTAAQRQVARLRHMTEELEARHRIAVQRETEKALDAQLARAEKEAARGRELMSEYEGHARAIASILNELREIERVVESANEALRKAGRSGRYVASPNHGRLSGLGIHRLPLFEKGEVLLPFGHSDTGMIWPEWKPPRRDPLAYVRPPEKTDPPRAPEISGSMVQSVGQGIV